ncbi:MAG: ABC transporter [Micrococcales bacterium]|nr:MAG: ABC transporter [Micrococcales bacterium]PIE26486.1 MAG: ABC transporter [Micrococcales bacterium]
MNTDATRNSRSTTTTGPAIETHDLTKTFTTRAGRETITTTAVDRLNLAVPQGQLLALLGPNGAGKSTTLRMLTTLLRPCAGTVRLHGIDVVGQPRKARSLFGFVGQGNGTGHLQHGRDEVVSQARAHGLRAKQARARADELIEALDLTEFAHRPVEQLSGGQRRRFDIAIGLVNRPAVLFLDEPSTGLDPQNRAYLQALVRDLHAETGSTIVLTTHYLDEADALSQRVVIIDHGRVIADDTATALKEGIGDLVSVRVAEARDDAVHLRTTDGPAAAIRLLDRLRADGHHVTGLEVRRPSLDDVFLHLTGRSLRETAETDQDTTTSETAA